MPEVTDCGGGNRRGSSEASPLRRGFTESKSYVTIRYNSTGRLHSRTQLMMI